MNTILLLNKIDFVSYQKSNVSLLKFLIENYNNNILIIKNNYSNILSQKNNYKMNYKLL